MDLMMNRQILNLIKQRLLIGEKKYGHKNVINDGRDFLKEGLEEVLDLAVYVSAKLIEIKEKEKQMGRAIDTENKLQALEDRVKLVEDALEEMIQTRVHHIDLTKDSRGTRDLKVEGVTVEPDENFLPPAGRVKKSKKTLKSKNAATV